MKRNERHVRLVEKNWVDVQTQRDRELKNGGKVMRMEEQVKELEKVVVKLRAQRGCHQGRGGCGGGVCVSLRGACVFSCRLVSRWLIYHPAQILTSGDKGASRCYYGRVQCRR